MANVKFLFKDAISDADVYSDNINTEVNTLPASNLKKLGGTKMFRTIGVSDGVFTVKVDFTSDQLIEEIYLLRTNFTPNGTVTIQLRDELGVLLYSHTQPVITGSTEFVTSKKNTVIKVPPTLVRKITIAVFDSGNTEGYLQANRLMAGSVYSTTINAEYGMDFGYDNETTQTRSMGGSLYSDNSEGFRFVNMALPELTKEEMTQLMKFAEYVGKTRDFLVNVYPDGDYWLEQALTFTCKFSSMPKFEQFSFDRWRTTFNLVEA